MSGPSGRDEALARLHRPFRPRAGRVVPWAVAVAGALSFAVVAATLPGASAGQRVSVLALAAVLVLLLSRFAEVRAVPTASGLVVRNLVATRTYAWAQIVSVTVAGEATWVHLDLADGSTASVMAVQAADGDYARREASRLATLVELYSSRPAGDAGDGETGRDHD